ncbi:MAG: hypothetical protein JO288_08610, partial [Hyphomicrobiales bacterium]|nr:hypothetical protein [Hyphomicrobiales bacterium]
HRVIAADPVENERILPTDRQGAERAIADPGIGLGVEELAGAVRIAVGALVVDPVALFSTSDFGPFARCSE